MATEKNPLGSRIKLYKLPNGERTEHGPYWAKVDGENIGENGRTHWQTEAAACLAAETYIAGVEGRVLSDEAAHD